MAALRMLTLGLCLACAALAEDQDYEGRRVSAIGFAPVLQPYARAELDRLLQVRVGEPLRFDAVRATLQSLYQTGRYQDLQVEAQREGENVRLTFRTELQYFISQVVVNGAKDPPNEGQLAGASKLILGEAFSENSLGPAAENLQERLRSNGLYQAVISTRVTRVPETQQARIEFDVQAGQRAHFDSLKLEGEPGRPADSLVRATRWQRGFGFFGSALGWRTVTESRVRSGVDNVLRAYQRDNLLLARVNLQRLEYHEDTNRVTPHLFVTPGPKVELTARGLKFPRGRLRSMVPIFQERAVDRDLLVEGRRNLLEYFQSQGYFDAQVDFTMLPPRQNEQVIEYLLDRGERRRLAALAIEGNRYFDAKTIRERMAITPATWLRYRRGRYSQKLLDKDLEAIRALYQSNGFLEADVDTEVEDNFNGRKGDIRVRLMITEGPQWFVDTLEVEGVADADRAYFQEVLSSLAGQPFSEVNLSNDRESILSYYFNAGYPDAALEWTRTDVRPQRVALKLVVRPGHQKFVRDVLVSGVKITRPDLVSNRIRAVPGEPLSEASLSETQRRLYDLGIFAKVQVGVQNPEGAEVRKYVLYQLDEARRYSVNFGIGAEIARIGGGTSFNAPAGGAGFSPRVLLGVSRINFLGLGHTVSLQTRASNIQQRALLSYFAPQFQGSDRLNLTVIGLFDNARDVRTFAARRLETSIQIGQRLSRANTIQYRYAFRRVTVDDGTLNINPQLIPLFSQPVRTGIFSTTFIQDRRDDPLDARRGSYNTVDFGVSAQPFGSRTSFARLLARNASYHRLTPNLIFARSVNFGLTERIAGVTDIPLPERFFSGGSFSHRGFPNNQAGPRDEITGFPLGGNALLLNTLELRFPLLGDNLGAALFHDAGNVYSRWQSISFRASQRNFQDFDYMAHAVGLGIRYKTPVGPLRVDVAYGLNSPRFTGFRGTREELLRCGSPGTLACASVVQKINGFQFHFSLGQAF
jgi:outer membrane protein assembly complex protein YaeT